MTFLQNINTNINIRRKTQDIIHKIITSNGKQQKKENFYNL